MATVDFDVKIVKNSKEFLKAVEHGIELGLEACGMTAEGYAKEYSPTDTSRLKNSITWATKTHCGFTKTYSDNEGNTYSQTVGNVPKREMHIGTSVEYAPYQELGTSTGIEAKHFLKNSIANHTSEYGNMIVAAIKANI